MRLTPEEKFEYLSKAIDVLLAPRRASRAEEAGEMGGMNSQSAEHSAKRKRSTSSDRK